jgi:hypothetical protein
MPASAKKKRTEDIKPDGEGVKKVTHSQLHDFPSTNEKGLPVQVKKETKKTTTIKPQTKPAAKAASSTSKAPIRKSSGPVADKDQRKQINDLI